jgi:1,4-dihydroxy-2-naphthoate octaprenyltransferase
LALLLANILLINGFPDAESDARVGKRTLVVRLGPAPAAGLYLGLVLLAHGWLAVSVWLLIPPQAALWGLVSLPLSLAAAGLLWRHASRAAAPATGPGPDNCGSQRARAGHGRRSGHDGLALTGKSRLLF